MSKVFLEQHLDSKAPNASR